MYNYWNKIENKGDIERGMFVILPLRYDAKTKLSDISVSGTQLPFESNDFIELLADKCCMNGNFVRRFQLTSKLNSVKADTEIPVTDVQLFVFNNGIAFLSVYLAYTNSNVASMYSFIYPGYTDEDAGIKSLQSSFLGDINEKILCKTEPEMQWFTKSTKSQGFILKEAYRLNVAYVPHRFKETDIVNRITYNEHRIIDLSRDFTDESETDVKYVTGARDVNSEDYGWGCSITSQEISYAYAKRDGSPPLADRAEDGLLLTMLVMYQKYMCMQLNEEIHQRYAGDVSNMPKKDIGTLKREAMEFVAYGTLAPSQISRWNNVCDTYRLLIEMNGINETIEEVEQKISLLDEEQERAEAKRESTIAIIIAVFGLVSIVSSVLEIVDYVSSGSPGMLISFVVSSSGVLSFGAILGKMLLKNKRNGSM